MNILTANLVLTGEPVYLAEDGTWSLQVDRARHFADKDRLEEARLAATREEAHICDPMGIRLVVKDGILKPKGLKFQLRAAGGVAALERLGLCSVDAHSRGVDAESSEGRTHVHV